MVKGKMKKTRKQSGRYYEEDQTQVFDLQRMMEGFLLEQNCKGNSQATIKYSEDINQERPEPANKKIDSLLLKNDGTPITQATIKQLFRRLKDKLKMEKLHLNLCRHTFCTMYLANRGDIFCLKQMTGHESFDILNNYVHLASSMMSIKNKNLSLLDGMKLKV